MRQSVQDLITGMGQLMMLEKLHDCEDWGASSHGFACPLAVTVILESAVFHDSCTL